MKKLLLIPLLCLPLVACGSDDGSPNVDRRLSLQSIVDEACAGKALSFSVDTGHYATDTVSVLCDDQRVVVVNYNG